ncbi:hypothetical protein QYF36_010077 [Acer negundo]|nr:hypothetical protein QYF36_010077 [Acer negundo]
MQQNQPIAYFSEALKRKTLALLTYDKEMLVMVKASGDRIFWEGHMSSRRTTIASSTYLSSGLQCPLKFIGCLKLWAVLAEGHSSSTGGYFGYLKMLNCISSSFVWLGIRIAVNEFIRSFDVCQCCLPTSQCHNVVMFIVDRLSKHAHFVTLKHPYTTMTVAKVHHKHRTTKVQTVDDLLRIREDILHDVWRNLIEAHARMKTQSDQQGRDVSFEVGDYVYLRLQPY